MNKYEKNRVFYLEMMKKREIGEVHRYAMELSRRIISGEEINDGDLGEEFEIKNKLKINLRGN